MSPENIESIQDAAVVYGLRPCLKQLTRCVVYTGDGRRFEATNMCAVPEDATVCPREEAGCATGEGYELCGSTHAEANTAAQIEPPAENGVATLYGHTWLCGPCQWALTAKGVRTFMVPGLPA